MGGDAVTLDRVASECDVTRTVLYTTERILAQIDALADALLRPRKVER